MARRALLLVVPLALTACDGDGTGSQLSLLGPWDLVGFSDGGVDAVTTGTAAFRIDATFSIDGTVTFPGEPTEPIAVDGTYQQTQTTVGFTIGPDTGAWTLQFSGDQVVLTQVEPPPANTITLRRQ